MGGLSRRSFVFAVLAAGLCGGNAMSQNATPVGTRVALKGYDPVSYFTDGKPEQGSSEFTLAFDDTTYWFKNVEHKALFAADPARYAPQFDGYCAVQMSMGIKGEADPESWAIKDGKLYVFSMKDGMAHFREDGVAIAEKANENWPRLRSAP
jgi:YHS domain-containing protein